jgi:hypothetical protein
MSMLDTWTDDVAERALRLLMVGEMVVRSYRTPDEAPGVRPVTVDRWLVDCTQFLEQLKAYAEATTN